MKYPALDLNTIDKSLVFPDEQYYKEETTKKQICLHHTASGRGATGDFRHWLSNAERVATPVIIGTEGTIFQLFQSKYWGHHLGIKANVFEDAGLPSRNTELNKHCIGIEIDAWGPLALVDGKFYSYVGTLVPEDEVTRYPEGYKKYPDSTFFNQHHLVGKPALYYHKYSDAQIRSTAQLLELWCNAYNIPKDYDWEMWDVNKRALSGEPGIFTHTSYRPDKADCHPQPELIEMLKSLA
jgi:N-acetyl-anhydromuramyl-L-alanine amidase AmpD